MIGDVVGFAVDGCCVGTGLVGEAVGMPCGDLDIEGSNVGVPIGAAVGSVEGGDVTETMIYSYYVSDWRDH